MEKELNPHLFGNVGDQKNSESTSGSSYYDPHQSYRVAEKSIDRAEIKRLDQQFLQLQDRNQEFVKTTTLKVEKVQQKFGQLDQRLEGLVQEVRSKYANLAGKLTERSLIESEVQALLERHNQLIRGFENKLGQMQKVIENQQMQLMNSHALVEEARREITRMKKMG